MPVFETPGQVAVRIDVPAGAVGVELWEEPRVDVRVTPLRGNDVSGDAARETRVEATEHGGRHEIVVEAPRRDGRLFGRGPELSVVVRCPEGTDVELTTHSADLRANGRLGDVSVRSASGDVAVLETAALTLTTASGDLAAESVDGGLVAKSASGDVEVRSVAGRSTVNTVSGDVVLGRCGGPAVVSTVSGDVELEAVESGVRVNAVSGDVHVALRAGLAVWIDAQSVSGTISSELDVGDGPADATAGALELRIRTVSGDVRLSRVVAGTA